jgi:glycosyltransferase involved in cell wall biosynthesis
MIKLSICIPTFNRSKYLAELLDSIVAQRIDGIEVVVSDDASPDDTVEIAGRYKTSIQNFKFIKQPVNLGLDRNFLEVTSGATGEYVWLMGDDDKVEPGGIAKVLSALNRWPDVVGLTLGVIDYDPTMTRVTGIRRMPETQLLTGAGPVFSQIAELLGFMSAMVVKRCKWQEASADASVELMKNLYSQVYIVGRALGPSGTWGVVNETCVGFRSDNDQFKQKVGWFERLKIDVRAYDEIADRLFASDPATHRAMRRSVFDTHVMSRLVNFKPDADEPRSRIKVAAYLIDRYGSMPKLWTRGIPVVLAPSALLRALRFAYKRFFKSSGAARARELVSKGKAERNYQP